MNGQPIPGFYYDEAKKKYFKIQSANASRHLDLRYSAENIRKRERVDKIKEAAAARVSKTRKERVVRHHANNLTNTCIEREIGLRRTSAILHRLWPNACMYGYAPLPHIAMPRPTRTTVRYFQHDPTDSYLFAVHGDNLVAWHAPLHSLDEASTEDGSQSVQSTEPYATAFTGSESHSSNSSMYTLEDRSNEVALMTSPVSSLNLVPGTGALVVTTYGSHSPAVVHLSDPVRGQIIVSQQYTPKDCSTIWDSAPRREHFESSTSRVSTMIEQVAVATETSLLMFTRNLSWDFKFALQNVESPLLSVDWLDYNTVAMGCRNGKVLLYDDRANGSSHILTHPNTVTKIKRADDRTRVICAGLNNTMHLYDIRMARPTSTRQQGSFNSTTTSHYNEAYFSNLEVSAPRRGKKRRRFDYANAQKWSQPVLTFRHSNIDVTTLDIAVHEELGLIAAAQDEQTDVAIRVSNIWTGEVVREFKREKPSVEKQESLPIRCLRWDGRAVGSVKLWANWDGGLGRFHW
ncbi:hypothetical protein NX059_001376 [Plenodomus lindquistii]|nr:hypothetical protein NX059_001376 [Plenodomus lindquistii]